MIEPVFSAPWHAQVFALTVHLSQEGHFTWPEWTETFGEALKRHGLAKELDGGDDYFEAWLDALEGMLSSLQAASPERVAKVSLAWRDAYLATPHGKPVHLAD